MPMLRPSCRQCSGDIADSGGAADVWREADAPTHQARHVENHRRLPGANVIRATSGGAQRQEERLHHVAHMDKYRVISPSS